MALPFGPPPQFKANTTPMSLELAAIELVRLLERGKLRIVFAESCTGGLVAAAVTSVPGVSAHLCGSAVTYREATKVEWLGLSRAEIDQYTAESAEVTEAMARQVLARTPEANLAAAVTGHLGPDAAAQVDGVIFVTVAWRDGDRMLSETTRSLLTSSGRQRRQVEAAEEVLQQASGIAQRLKKP